MIALWIVLAVMALAAVAAVALPLLTTRRVAEVPRAARDVALFRDQLAELERERAEGEIGGEEAIAAKREIERRLLAAGRALETTPKPALRAPTRGPRLRLAVALAMIMAPAAFLIYFTIGTPEAPAILKLVDEARARDAERRTELTHLVNLVEQRLAEAPDDGQGWGLLASAKLRLGKMDDARTALANAKRYLPKPQAAEMTARFAQTLADVSEGQAVSPVVRYANEALELDQNNGRARMLLAIMSMQTGDTDGARAQWTEIVKRLPADSPFYAEAKTALDRLDKGQAPTAPPGQ